MSFIVSHSNIYQIKHSLQIIHESFLPKYVQPIRESLYTMKQCCVYVPNQKRYLSILLIVYLASNETVSIMRQSMWTFEFIITNSFFSLKLTILQFFCHTSRTNIAYRIKSILCFLDLFFVGS